MYASDPSFHKLTNANNVVYHFANAGDLRYESLTLFVDFTKKVTAADIASCQNGTIEGLPITISMKVWNFGVIRPDALLQGMKEFTGSRQLDSLTSWSIEDKMLRLDIDLSSFPNRTEKEEAGKPVELVKLANAMVMKQCRLSLNITSTGKVNWPLMQSQPSHTFNPVLSRLSTDLHTGPENNLEISEDLGARRERISDALTVDARKLNDVKVIFNPRYNHGDILSTSINLTKGITIQILIEIMHRGDARIKRKREASVATKAPINVKLKVTPDSFRKEKTLTIRFNANESYGMVDFGAIPEFYTLRTSGGSGPATLSSVRAHHRVHRVAECSKAREDIFIVDFIAVRAVAELPTEREIYISIHNYMKSVKEITCDLDMKAVREHLLLEYPYMQTADRDELQKFSFLVWGCIREYAVNQILGLPHSMLRDEGNILAKMIPV